MQRLLFDVNRRRLFGEKGDERLYPAGFLGVRQVVEIDAGVGFPVVAQYRPEALAVGLLCADGREQAANAEAGADGVSGDVDVVAVLAWLRRAVRRRRRG